MPVTSPPDAFEPPLLEKQDATAEAKIAALIANNNFFILIYIIYVYFFLNS